MEDYNKRVQKNFFKVFGILSALLIIGILLYYSVSALFGPSTASFVILSIIILGAVSFAISTAISV